MNKPRPKIARSCGGAVMAIEFLLIGVSTLAILVGSVLTLVLVPMSSRLGKVEGRCDAICARLDRLLVVLAARDDPGTEDV